MLVLGVDPGIINMGLVLVEVDEHVILQRVLKGARVDLTQLKHKKVSREQCQLYHSSMHCDWIDHLLQEYSDWFSTADVVVVEQQPPEGHASIEQLVIKACRSKAVRISPRTVHSYFDMGDSDYDTRKEIIVAKTEHLLSQFTDGETRKHDIADALAMVMCYLHKQRQRHLEGLKVKWLDRITAHRKPVEAGSLSDRLQQYRRKPTPLS